MANTILEAVANYLAANTHGTLGTDLFMGSMQDEPDVCRAVFESPGVGGPIETMGAAAWAVDRPRVRVVVRGARDDYQAPRDEAQAIRLLLAAVVDQTLSTIKVMRIQSTGAVEPLGVDSDDRPLFAVDFNVWVG